MLFAHLNVFAKYLKETYFCHCDAVKTGETQVAPEKEGGGGYKCYYKLYKILGNYS